MLREERRLRVFVNRVLRNVFGPIRYPDPGTGEDYVLRSFMMCTRHQILSG
jgi:hypothetical protein